MNMNRRKYGAESQFEKYRVIQDSLYESKRKIFPRIAH